jgi:hypothetical protein
VSRMPWPLTGRAAADLAALRVPAYSAPPRPSTARTDYEASAASWTAREAAVLDRLADAGGDLHAHETVHLEDR